jgi:hypothetical protein
VGSSQGNWYNSDLDISLHPDFQHPGDVASHYDLKIRGSEWRWYEGDIFQDKSEGGSPLSPDELNQFQSILGVGPAAGVGSFDRPACDPELFPE